MAADVKGTAHYYGVDASNLSNAQIMSIGYSHEFGLNETTPDSTGKTIATHRDDRVKRVSLTLRIRPEFTFPQIGQVIALANCRNTIYNGNYEVEKAGESVGTNQYHECTFDLVQHEGITYSLGE